MSYNPFADLLATVRSVKQSDAVAANPVFQTPQPLGVGSSGVPYVAGQPAPAISGSSMLLLLGGGALVVGLIVLAGKK